MYICNFHSYICTFTRSTFILNCFRLYYIALYITYYIILYYKGSDIWYDTILYYTMLDYTIRYFTKLYCNIILYRSLCVRVPYPIYFHSILASPRSVLELNRAVLGAGLTTSEPHTGVSENRGPSYSSLNSSTLAVRTPNKAPPIFQKLPYTNKALIQSPSQSNLRDHGLEILELCRV